MARAYHSKTFPASGDSFSLASFNNEFNAMHQGDFQPLRPRAHSTPDMGIMIEGANVESFYQQCYSSGDFPLLSISGDVTFTAPVSNPRIDIVFASGDGYYKNTGAEAVTPTLPRMPSGDGVIPICYIYHKATEVKIVNYEDTGSNPDEGYIYRDIRPLYVSTYKKIQGHQLRNLSTTPSSAGKLPVANIDTGTTANKILALDGSGKIPVVDGSQLTNLPTAAYIKVSDVKANGVSGGNSTASSWLKRDINTEDIDTGNNCSIGSDQITLLAGTYECLIISPMQESNYGRIRLYNTTDASVTLQGSNGFSYSSGGSCELMIIGRFTIAGTKVFEIQYYCTKSTTGGLGAAVSTGEQEVYTVAEFRKVA